MVIKMAHTYIALTLWQVLPVNKCFMQTNLLYPHKDPRGQGLLLPSLTEDSA